MATVAGTPYDFDDLLGGTSSPWRRRLIVAGIILITAAAGFFAWNQWFRGGSSAAAPAFAEAKVTTGNVTKTISTSGTVSAAATANLNFSGTSEKITEVNVAVGQSVKQGDVLARIDPTDANNALTTAKATLANAEVNLQQVVQGSTAAQLAQADQSLIQAQTGYNNAVNALNTLKQPPASSALAAAQQAVTTAQSQLQTAQEAQSNLTTNAQAEVQTAQANVQKAQLALNSAQAAYTNASENAQIDQGKLAVAETAYCASPDPAHPVSFCTVQAYPISVSDANALVEVTGTEATAAGAVLSADSAYRGAVTQLQSVQNSVTNAQNDLNSANTALTTAQGMPTQAQVTAAASAVTAAQSALDTAQYNLETLQAGPTQQQLDSAQGAVDQAAAALKSSQASHDQTYAGSTAAQIQQARTSVQQAQITVAAAQKGVDDTKLTAPFDGTVAALNIHVGDLSGTSSSSSSSGSSAAIVLNTPNRLVLDLTIAEADYPSVKVGDTGVATFSALPGEEFPFVIDTLGSNPTSTQGVVTYDAQAHLATGQEAAQILASLRGTAGNASGNSGFGQTLANQSQPAPGMSATVEIIVDQKTGVVTVPSKAVQTKNRQTVVTVKKADGTTQDVQVTTGLSDSSNTEITSGLTDGQTIEIPGTTATTTTTQSLPATGGSDGGGGGFFGG